MILKRKKRGASRLLLITHRYSDSSLSDGGLRDFAATMRVEFDKWHETLPAELKVDLSDENRFYLPHVLQLQ